MIVLENVHKSLGGKPVLRGVSLQVAPGETYVIIGPSGVGKSVTLKTIIGLLHPDAGQVLINGQNLADLHKHQLYEIRKLMGVLFQNGALLNWLDVGQNVALPLVEHTTLSPAAIARQVQAKLGLVDLHGVEHLMPASLSGGMRKRVGLARAIIRDPQIILYDEPTSGLDPVMSHQIDRLILNLQAKLGVTSIVVTHDMTSAYRIANRIGMLYGGQIIAEGTPAQIQQTRHPVVRQFIEGRVEGPLTSNLDHNN